MNPRQPVMTTRGSARWTEEQRLRIAGQLMAPLMHAKMERDDLLAAAALAWAGVRALERAANLPR